MKLIIAGSRHLINDFNPMDARYFTIAFFSDVEEIVCGCASGPDEAGRRFAQQDSIKVAMFPADWGTHGRAAGPIRNRQMAEYADGLLLVWDGKSNGSKSMLTEARKVGLRIVQIILETQDA